MSGSLAGKRIVLGVCGGIAAYKAVEVCRRLVDAGAHVVPVLTSGARHFIGDSTFSALASEPVRSSLWNDADPIPHTRLGQGADLVLVCPATARLLSDLRTGRSADLLTATLVATRAPVVVAPAMHTEMWEHPSVQDNMAVLVSRGVHVVPPESGRLAGGDMGHGRLADPATVVAAVERVLGEGRDDLVGQHVVVTAGGTREPIDPVRYIGNRSSGKQGLAIAAEAAARGARVTLVATVPAALPGPHTVIAVETAAEMHAAVTAAAIDADMLVMAAAVADFRPASVAQHKLKKHQGAPEIVLVPTLDILADVGRTKPERLTVVGFAAETDDVLDNAAAKLHSKGADLIVANDVSAPGVGFAHETNAVTILSADGVIETVGLADKRAVAAAVFDAVAAYRARRDRG